MKKLIITILFFLPIAVTAQTEPTTTYDIARLRTQVNNVSANCNAAGRELESFRRGFYSGTAVQAAGVLLAVISGVMLDGDSQKAVFAVSGATFLVGTSISFSSFNRVGHAGKLLQMEY